MPRYSVEKPVGVIGETYYAYFNETVFLGEFDTVEEAKAACERHAQMMGRICVVDVVEE